MFESKYQETLIENQCNVNKLNKSSTRASYLFLQRSGKQAEMM